MNSPLGKYSQVVAAITALSVIGGYLLAVALSLPGAANEVFTGAFYIAIGAVFGSAAGVNGWKSEVAALHSRLDRAGLPAAGVK